MSEGQDLSKLPSDWGASMLYNMQQLRRSGLLCDLTLVAGRRSLPVHKAYIAAASDYFQAMLTSGMQETYQETIELKGVSEVGLEAILDFVYSGVLTLTTDNVCDVLTAAAHLQVPPAIQYCSSFLSSVLAVDNALDVLNVARLYSLERVQQSATLFVQRHLLDIIAGGHHLLMDFTDLKATLARKNLEFGPEWDIYRCITQWGMHEPELRREQLEDLMTLVKFPLMEKHQLIKILEDNSDSPWAPAARDALRYLHQPIHHRILVRSDHVSVRSKPTILAYPSYQLGRTTQDLYILAPGCDRWLKYPDVELGQYSTYAGAITSLNNFLIICGGYHRHESATERDEVTNLCYIFDPNSFRWSQIASMKTPRTSFPLVVCTTGLYALGGLKKIVRSSEQPHPRMHGIHTLGIERYDFKSNLWEEVAWLSQATKNHAACALESKIFVSGGELEDQSISDQMVCYDTSTRSWQQLEPLSEPVSGHFMFGLKGKVLAIGLDDEYTLISGFGVEVYTPSTNQWTALRATLLPRGSEVIHMDGRLYFLNGWKLQNEDDDSTRYIQSVSVKFDGIGLSDYKVHFSYLDVDYLIGAPLRIPVDRIKRAKVIRNGPPPEAQAM